MNAYIKEAKRKILSLNPNHNDKSAHDFDAVAAAQLKSVSRAGKASVFALLVSQETGLTEDQVEEKLQQFGANEVAHEKAPAWYVQLLQAFINPFIGILIVIAIVSLITDVFLAAPEDRDYKTLIVVCIMVMLSSLLRFWQEFRSNLAAEQLKSMVRTTATVLRRMDADSTRNDADSARAAAASTRQEIDIKQLVPGDLIFLSAGDMIPADCRILQSKDLFISQAMLTGEALPVE
jgi:Mg2+-importing ATPase